MENTLFPDENYSKCPGAFLRIEKCQKLHTIWILLPWKPHKAAIAF